MTRRLSAWLRPFLLAAAFLGGVDFANSQHRPCSDHASVVAALAETFQEKQFAFGVIGHMAIMEIFVSESGSWTILVTDVQGKSCIIAAGENWETTSEIAGIDASDDPSIQWIPLLSL
ncbi:hypothetical protein PZ895_05245 [Mesorhizobium sp. YIM 152430]|uniref:hypothetical protein n=1 Tax=Mesorhizobium sp. YIM 152430 TaxID=3031761 RepID=UPI0023D9D7BF|nr:hypothetical protein [Mesorhizobium sp. YIM 152430]MDF1599182.1 hypothetical protein [Mesorhizobium sp. YIM 152430]